MSRLYSLVSRFHPLALLILLGTLFVSIVVFTHSNSYVATFDEYILAFIATVFFLAAAFMIHGTKWYRWTYLSSGLLATFLADMMLYGAAAYTAFHQPFMWYDVYLLFVRALFVVGGTWVLIGMFMDWYEERARKRQKKTERESVNRQR